MGSTKASLILYFLFFLHLQHNFFQATSRSTPRLATVDPSHFNLPVQSVESKHEGGGFSDKTAELAVVAKRGGGGGRSFGGGGRSFGGGGRGFGGGGRSFGGGEHGGGNGGRSTGGRGGRSSGGSEERPMGGRGVYPVFGGGGGGGGSHHGGKRSSGDRNSVSVWLGLSTLVGLVLGF
ncbi:hypothetical protein Bca52824_021352 [Brassica carinata]|uniref:Glycine-rich protein n=1 Tax=Brassica carinata TaxID=52824 RepID=A0A8X7VWD0_BRACI|nr:hypothetical protein Bca52824_021352 [Brassica carinata]